MPVHRLRVNTVHFMLISMLSIEKTLLESLLGQTNNFTHATVQEERKIAFGKYAKGKDPDQSDKIYLELAQRL